MLVEKATEETLIEERELILQEKDAQKRAHLLAAAVTVASRYFNRDFLWQFFSEEVEQMRSVPIIQDWIEEGIQQGRQEGYIQARKEDIISILENRFGIVKSALLDELEKKDPEIPDDLKDVKIGGLGIHIVRKLMDDLHYERKNGKNKLTLKKMV